MEQHGPVVTVRGLSKRFGATLAVDDVSFTLEAGEMLALVGPNGAGKSTTLRMLATLLPPDRGEIHILGLSVRDPFPVRRKIGFMPDVLGIYPEMLVGEYLEFFARAYEIEERLIGYSINEVSSFAGLEQMLETPAAGLSRGMLQRVALARALLHDPAVLLLDEPAAGLDPRSRAEFRQMLLELRKKGKTAVISSHVLSDLEETCNRIAVIEEGRLQVLETMSVFLERARGDRTYRVALAAGAERAHAILAERPEVSRLRWEGDTLVFEMPREKGVAARLLRALVGEEEIEVEAFAEVAVSLEEAYLVRTDATK
jgi:ABC-2 type transport system ATP-binding protein